jgi:hypothetical protein
MNTLLPVSPMPPMFQLILINYLSQNIIAASVDTMVFRFLMIETNILIFC